MNHRKFDGRRPSLDNSISTRLHGARGSTRSTLTALCLLSGCATYSPEPIDPFLELEQLEQRAVGTRQLETVSPVRRGWIPLRAEVDLTDGLDVAEANALALFYSPEIRSSRRDERVAGAQLLSAGVLANPQLFLGPRISTKTDDVIFPASISWQLPLWGQRDAEKNLAARELSAAQVRVLAIELRVLADVRQTFIRIASLRRTVDVLEAQLAATERVLEWIASLERAGEIDAVTVYLAGLERDEVRAEITATRLRMESSTRKLFEAIGLLPSAELALVLTPDPAALPELPERSRETLLLHPEIRAALREYDVAEAALKLEVARQYPRIRVGPEFEDDRGDASVGIGIGVELPLFDRNQGGVADATERREAARERLEHALLSRSHSEAQARAEWKANERMLGDYRSGALEIADQARAALEARLAAGQTGVLEVLAALRSLTRARVRVLKLERESATARLRAAVAGGAVLTTETATNPPEPAETEKNS